VALVGSPLLPLHRIYIEVTRQWWEEERQHFDLWVSDETIAEVSRGEYPNKTKIIECVSRIAVLTPASVHHRHCASVSQQLSYASDLNRRCPPSRLRLILQNGFFTHVELSALSQREQKTTYPYYQYSLEPVYPRTCHPTRTVYGAQL